MGERSGRARPARKLAAISMLKALILGDERIHVVIRVLLSRDPPSVPRVRRAVIDRGIGIWPGDRVHVRQLVAFSVQGRSHHASDRRAGGEVEVAVAAGGGAGCIRAPSSPSLCFASAPSQSSSPAVPT